jgi:formyltetrahydrofolate-dependent phosphoribosylglycinamide formyltransferase
MIRKRAAILISGRGSNMAALIEATKDPAFPAEIVLVLSNKADAAGLALAAANGIPTAVVSHRDYPSREAFDAALNRRLEEARTEIVCLAGFMRVLTPVFVDRWAGRAINIHPSLLPALPGLDTHERALALGLNEHGCTVHFVSQGVDEGAIIAQAKVPVEPGDTPDTLAARVLEAEHRLYPLALRKVASAAK